MLFLSTVTTMEDEITNRELGGKKTHTIEYIIEVMFSEPKIRTNDIEMAPESHALYSHHLSTV